MKSSKNITFTPKTNNMYHIEKIVLEWTTSAQIIHRRTVEVTKMTMEWEVYVHN